MTKRTTPQSLRQYLAESGVSQRQLAAAVGCNQSMVSMLVRGKRVPSGTLAGRLHAVTKVPLAVLLGIATGTAQASKTRRRPNPRSNAVGRHASP